MSTSLSIITHQCASLLTITFSLSLVIKLSAYYKMASRNGEEKVERGFNDVHVTKTKNDWILLSLRVVAFFATAAATLVMALNKQTKSFIVGTVGNTPITATLSAKFNQTPAFV